MGHLRGSSLNQLLDLAENACHTNTLAYYAAYINYNGKTLYSESPELLNIKSSGQTYGWWYLWIINLSACPDRKVKKMLPREFEQIL